MDPWTDRCRGDTRLVCSHQRLRLFLQMPSDRNVCEAPAWTPRAAAASCLFPRESRVVYSTKRSQQPHGSDRNLSVFTPNTEAPKSTLSCFDLCSKILMCLLSSHDNAASFTFLLYQCTSVVSPFGSGPAETGSDSRWTCFTLLPHGVVFSFLIRALLKGVACVNMSLFIVFLISAFIVLPYFHAEAIKIFFN